MKRSLRHRVHSLLLSPALFPLGILALLTLAGPFPAAHAGGTLEVFDITGRQPAGREGQVIAGVAPARLDPRCMPWTFRLNDTVDPIPNPLGADFLTLAEVVPVFETAIAQWNAVPTSYVEMRLEGTTANPGTQRFDTIPEITFRTRPDFGLAFASSVLTCLIEDRELAPGTDLDGDGDADVVGGIERCADTDGDGDVEFPAGFYRAGTILDADIQFNTLVSTGFRFTTDAAEIDTERKSVDLPAVALHELGHAHGLAHSLSNQISDSNGTQAAMFPFIDSGDPADQLAARHLAVEDRATTSLFYPEGTAAEGPAALQPGDVPFATVYGVLEGDAVHGVQDLPLAGASVFAINALTGELRGSAITGTVRAVVDTDVGATTIPQLGDGPFHVRDGRWKLPLPLGFYKLGLEAVDNFPVSSGNVNITTRIGAELRQTSFPEELYGGPFLESSVEIRPGLAFPVLAGPGIPTPRLRWITNRNTILGPPQFVNDSIEAKPGTFLARQIPAEDLRLATAGRDFAVVAARFATFLGDRSTVPRFRQALLAEGWVDESTGTAHLNLDEPLARQAPLIGQDSDDSLFFLPFPRLVGGILRFKLDHDEIQNLFLVVEGPREPLPGVSRQGPFLGTIRLAVNAPPSRSFVSTDGVTFQRLKVEEQGEEHEEDCLFDLVLSELP